MKKILILANHYNTLRIFRRELIKELVAQGNQVVVCIPTADDENINILKSYGCEVEITDMERRGMNPLKDISLMFKYIKLIKKIKPDKVITYTIKCNIYGSLASSILKVDHYVNVTGLGSAFQTDNFIKRMIIILYKLALRKANLVFFENVGNRDVFVENKIITKDRTVVMPGAGVNLQEFEFTPYPQSDETRFLFVGRIMKEKGVDELFYAIRKLKKKYSNIRFEFIGWYEDDYEKEVEELQEEGLITYYGFKPDVRPYIRNSHCIVLPSYHEGMSNTLLEAAAMGRPLITTDIHGCKESVVNEKNGYLFKLKSRDDLKEKIEQFILTPKSKRVDMGKYSRVIMEDNFDKYKVVDETIRNIIIK